MKNDNPTAGLPRAMSKPRATPKAEPEPAQPVNFEHGYFLKEEDLQRFTDVLVSMHEFASTLIKADEKVAGLYLRNLIDRAGAEVRYPANARPVLRREDGKSITYHVREVKP